MSTIWTNLGVVYVVWGSTYAAIALVVETMPPLMSAGLRFLTAGALLATFLLFRKTSLAITRQQFLSTSLIAILLLAIGNGAVMYGEQTISSGVASLLICGTPLWMAVFRTITGDHLGKISLVGIAVGFIGMMVLVLPGSEAIEGADPAAVTAATIIVLIGSFTWSIGSFVSKKLTLPSNPFVYTTWQMLIGGVVLLIGGAVVGEKFDLANFELHSWLGWFYLVTVGSLLAYSSYVWLLGNAPISLVATYAYVNPVVAVVLGVLFLRETFTSNMLIGGIIVVLGVVLTISGERPPSTTPSEG
jgi:drug/metabolite transporter (DMT)-like permease